MKLSMNDTVNVGRGKEKLVADLVDKNGKIFELIKNGAEFDDEVLKEAHITKTIHDVKFVHEFTKHQKDTKVYEKEKESLKNVLKSINTIDSPSNNIETEEAPKDDIVNGESYDD